ncbi:DUF4405 domain-containing protein [Deltaproteobacteria bacterium OttesenSCG-928-M10]|nr:DUF4405 domain-containing protein [Deltaproteobacteria bacterium OttesenSCG-928-M10]
MSRKFVSLTLFFSFIVVFASSTILYIIPGARNAAGAWSYLGLNRGQWVDVHITCGLLFLAFCAWHTILNWKSISGVMKKAVRRNFQSAGPVMAALALNVFLVVGSLYHLQPVEPLLAYYKEAKQELRGGRPPASAALQAGESAQPENPSADQTYIRTSESRATNVPAVGTGFRANLE